VSQRTGLEGAELMMRKKTKELAHKEDEDKDSYKEDED
jgi:hypothetical protein